MLEASPLPASPVAAGRAVSVQAGQELWGTWRLMRAAGSAAAQPVTCTSPLKAGKCSVETPPPTPSDPRPLHRRAPCCFPSLLSHSQLPFLFFFHPAGRDIFCSWLLLLETGVPTCLLYMEILDKREFFSFQTPFLFSLFLPPDSAGSGAVPFLKAAS